MMLLLKITTTIYLILTLLISLLTQSGNTARLYLQQIPLQDEKLLVLNVVLTQVADLYGAELQLRYDPTRLRVRDEDPRLAGVQITPGPLLRYEERFIAKNMVDQEAGLVTLAMTLLNPAPAVTGEGILATIVFEIIDTGPYAVDVAMAKLAASTSEALPVAVENWRMTAPPSTATPSSSWWWGLLPLGLLLVAGGWWGLRWARGKGLVGTQGPTVTRHIPGRGHTAPQVAALLTMRGNHALSQGQLEDAYEYFSQAIERDPTNAEAWLGKGLVAQQETEKQICFQRVLALEPDNETAKEGLWLLKQNQ